MSRSAGMHRVQYSFSVPRKLFENVHLLRCRSGVHAVSVREQPMCRGRMIGSGLGNVVG